MSASTDRIAAKLAEEAMIVMQQTGNDRFYVEVAEMIGAASHTLEEAFVTEVRIRLAARSAMSFIKAHKKPVSAENTKTSPPSPSKPAAKPTG